MRLTPLAAVVVSAALTGCWTQQISRAGQARADQPDGGTTTSFQLVPSDNQLDLVFVIDDSGGGSAQQKLAAQLPAMIQTLQSLPGGLPDLHVGVVSSDLGAGPNAPAGCTETGEAGQFQTAPQGSCIATTLSAGAGFISNSYGATNFTDPIDAVVHCILPLGTGGCGFAQPLAALARALGADGRRPPEGNAGFLRANAGLAIVILSAVDDCSMAPGSDLLNTDPGATGLSDPLGPLTHYRCNRYGHLCTGGGMMRASPPLGPALTGPDDHGTEQLTDCVANDQPDARLQRVSDLVAAIRKLKPRPDDQIAVAALVGPPAPYGVRWTAAGAANPQNPDELWPSVMKSCGAAGDPAVNPNSTPFATDGTSGEPAVRIGEFVRSFARRQIGSICDASYMSAFAAVAGQLADVARGVSCRPMAAQDSGTQQPACTVVAQYDDQQKLPASTAIPNCEANGGQLPCWTAGSAGSSSCPARSRPFEVDAPREFADQPGLIYDVSCRACDTNTTVAGCP